MKSETARDLLKVVASVGILLVLLVQVGPADVAAALANVEPILIAAAISVGIVDVVIRSANWRLLLESRGARLGFGDVFYSFAVGGFVGQIVPSSLGVDVMRSLTLSRRREVPLAETLSSVVVLNLLSLGALTAMAALGIGWMLWAGVGPPGLPLVLAGSVAYLLALLLAIRSTRRFVRVRRVLRRSRIGRKVDGFLRALLAYRSVGRRLWPVFGLTLLAQGFAVLIAFLVYQAGGVRLGLLYFAAFVPLIMLLRTLPITLAGFGAEQGFAVLLFHSVGVPVAKAFAMSVIVSAIALFVTSLWGIFYIVLTMRRVGGVLGYPPAGGAGASPMPGEGE